RLTRRAGLDRVYLLTLGPARVEDEDRLLQVLPRSDVEAGLVEEPAPRARGRVELEARSGGRDGRLARPLAEDVEEGEHRDGADEREQAPPKPHALPPPLEVTVPLEDDRVRDLRHAPRFGGG